MLEQLASWPNLLLAYRKAARGKRGQAEVAAFEHRLEDRLTELRQELLAGEYRPGGYRSFAVHEPKRRWISAAPFRDRVVHHALCNQIEPIFETSFSDASFANRCGKGTHRALDRAQELAQAHPFVLQVDVQQFFPSIDHQILRTLLAARLADERVLAIVDRVLESGGAIHTEAYRMVYFPGDDLFAVNRPRGLPIGNLTSQFWANVYLDPIDQRIETELRGGAYVRYVDDLLLFGASKAELWVWLRALRTGFDRLRLTIHRGAHPRPVAEGFPFLGFTVSPQRRRLKRRKGVHFRRKLRAQVERWKAGALLAGSVRASLQGWLNHVRFGDTAGLQRAVLAALPEALRPSCAQTPLFRPKTA